MFYLHLQVVHLMAITMIDIERKSNFWANVEPAIKYYNSWFRVRSKVLNSADFELIVEVQTLRQK